MPTRRIQRGPATGGPPPGFQNSPSFNELYVDGLTDQLQVGTGTSGVGSQPLVQSLMAAFVEDATTTTYTATFPIPAGAILEDIVVLSTVLWGATGTVNLSVGDAQSATGWFIPTNLKATDLLVGERLQASNASCWGGQNGLYLTAAGRFGQQSGNAIGGYCPAAYNVIVVINVVSPAATVGRTFAFVTYQLPPSVVPTRQ